MDRIPSNLLDEALGLDDPTKPSPLLGRLLLVEDCVETTGAFVLHHLLKRAFSSPHSSNAVVFIAFSQSFAHYDRVLRKLGCNLAAQRDSGRFFFFDMLTLGCSDRSGKEAGEGVLVGLYCKIQRAVSALIQENKKHVTIVIDDIPLLEVAANGSSNHVLDFLHYCHTLTSEIGCSIIALNHEDVYMDTERPLILQMEYLADVLIKVGPLATGIAKDVHGQLTVVNKPVGELEESFGQEKLRDVIIIPLYLSGFCYGEVARLLASVVTLRDAIRRRSIEILANRKRLLALQSICSE